MTAAVADAFWILAAIQAVTIRRRSDSTLLRSALAFAVAFTLQQDEVYVGLDGLLGGHNWAAFLTGLAAATGTFLLSRSVIRAVRPADYRAVSTASAILYGCALLTQAVTFLYVTDHPTAPDFTMAYGDHPPVFRYAITMGVYLVLVLGLTGGTALAFFNRMSSKRFRIGFLITGAACVLGTLEQILAGIRAWMRYRYNFDFLTLTDAPDDLLSFAAFSLLAIGLLVPPLMGLVGSTSRHRHARARVQQLHPVWEKATRHRREQLITTAGSPTARLHRMLIEIRDAILHRPYIEDELGPEAMKLVDRAEQWLSKVENSN